MTAATSRADHSDGNELEKDRRLDHPVFAIYGCEEPPPPRTLIDVFQSTADRYPDTPALESDTEELTYAQLRERVLVIADRLHEAGVRLGDRVGVRVPSGTTDLYVAILAIMHAGAAYVPVDWDDPDERAVTVFSEAEVAAVVGKALQITPYQPALQRESQDVGQTQPSPEHDAWVLFTSGSTGTPKGVAVTHRSAAALVDVEADLFLRKKPIHPGDRVMAGLSVAFDASCEEMWLAWRRGGTLVAAPRDVVRSGPDLGKWIVDQAITVVSTVPTLASLWPPESLDAVRLLIFGGEAIQLDLIVRLEKPGREIWNTYGPTETTVIVSGAMMAPEPPVRIGRPITGWHLAVVDPVTEQPVKWGETGELVVGGVGVARYLDAERDAVQYAPLKSLGWERAYRTGDMVVAEQTGLIFVGRTDDQIKLGGKRIELGEIDEYLSELPGVSAGAAVLQKTNGGAEILVGYLTEQPGETIDIAQSRHLMSQRLPGGVVPMLAVVDELPMKTSGKVDRKALPWPLPSDDAADDSDLSITEAWLKDLWVDQLGPLPMSSATNFFEIGGGSVQVARLMANIRTSHATAEIRELYAHPTLSSMAAYLDSLESVESDRPMPDPLPLWPKVFQLGFIVATYGFNAVRYVVALIAVVWLLGWTVNAGWVPSVPVLPVIVGWLLMFSTPGKMLQASAVARLLTIGIRPGSYQRGGWTHVRLWASERFLHSLRLESVAGTVFARTFYRMMGNRVGQGTHIANLPPVSGLVTVGAQATIEFEADLNGYWVEGGTVHVGAITVEDGARIGTRSIVDPGVTVGAFSEVLPGSHISRDIPVGELWGGSPIRYEGDSGVSWPHDQLLRRDLGGWRRSTQAFAHGAGLLIMTLLPVLAIIPGAAIVLPIIIDLTRFEQVALIVAAWVPLVAILMVITWLALVIILVRILAGWIVPGYFLEASATGWAVWFTQALLQRTLISAYPIYASLATPTFLRLLGAKVGRDTEISTIETVPHLTWLQDRTFIADHALVTSTRHRHGWVHIGTTVIGEGTFIGNSAIVGPDTDLPPEALIAVMSSTPRFAPTGTSWLGRPAQSIPRTVQEADAEATYHPPRRIKWARGSVEVLRFLPFMITVWIELGLVVALNAVYMTQLAATESQLAALGITIAAALPLTLATGVVSTLLAVAAKWLLVGRFRPTEYPLFSTFVWRNELADVFAESLAVPALVRVSIGSPLFNVYARLMGSKIGRDVWCETWWLPEFDLIEIGDRATINRGTVVQTHLFQDRVMALSRTRIEPGGTLGASSFMLPGSTIGDKSVVGVGSLVLRDETLPPDTYWQGNPVQFIHDDAPAALDATPALLKN